MIHYRLHRRRRNVIAPYRDVGAHHPRVPVRWPIGLKQVWHATSPETGAVIGVGSSKAAARAELRKFTPAGGWR